MSNRTHHARDVRILPVAGTTATVSSPSTRVSASTAAQFARLLAAQAGAGPMLVSPDGGGASDHDAQDDPEHGAADDLASGTGGDAIRAEPAESRAFMEPAPSTLSRENVAQPASVSAPRTLRLQRARGAKEEAPPQPEHDAMLGRQIVHACAAAAHGDLLTRELADRIARFCAMSGAGGDSSWAVTLPMNPAVLPDTLLHLQLSPSSIAIRFETPSARSLQLISDNADALRARLAEALGRQIDVEVAASSV
ncbi:MAG TPA: type III secretion system protein SctP [Trinickia sp.]|uniref:type III secretion system protein SctP n=1 Tax=Trinickia sp. TaxID=2571163 RepID=UPI002C9B0719|nr:type III secretion system protein SctP [Trinickia sp.]HVW50447.1 type III secretion system protein SctP [Trinickia sp.]